MRQLVLVTTAGASHEPLQRPIDAVATEPGAAPIDVLVREDGEQARALRDGRADAALMHRPFDDLVGFDTADLLVEGQIALRPARHPRASRDRLTLSDVGDVPDLPIADVYMAWAAVNRDPRVFDRPAEFRLDRAHHRHISFGHDVHTCPEEFGRRQAAFGEVTVAELHKRRAVPRDDYLTVLAGSQVEGAPAR